MQILIIVLVLGLYRLLLNSHPIQPHLAQLYYTLILLKPRAKIYRRYLYIVVRDQPYQITASKNNVSREEDDTLASGEIRFLLGSKVHQYRKEEKIDVQQNTTGQKVSRVLEFR